ncbi:PREDICTED: uncharacterized protein LOC108612296 [Drosophila arizonae]|uniref:Uncharacterized protein LOC108612296 n=1 Tax=Drosophila arizonae TaxID=7263 RepID=A0ABM1P0D8_DROAR|nr:PREDICTED: uncharacterized protein LOC108612296 [Drosophila arizonae]XP_017860674.1 PREDICTED: uncharacterized protein LOC108612296 [Drosophila arizonae]
MSQTLDDLLQRQEHARQLRLATRPKFRRFNSLDRIPEHPSQDESENEEHTQHRHFITLRRQRTADGNLLRGHVQASSATRVQSSSNLLLLVPQLLMRLFLTLLRYMLYIPLSIAAPSFWLSAVLWIFWKLLRVPIGLFKWLLSTDEEQPGAPQRQRHRQRTVLLSCGSTIQTLHLARNFYGSGARVVVFEFEGLFGLARFSSCVDKFYVVPRPTKATAEQYIAALCHIVRKERPTVYVPVCATSPAYYDSLAKPHLELLGCASFVPGARETQQLDDCLQLFRRCEAQRITLPAHTVITAPEQLHQLYEGGFAAGYRNIFMACGMQGVMERHKYILPTRRVELLKFNQHEISERQPWLVVRDQPGYHHYVTCTTVKDSRVVANVSCRVEHNTKNLIPVRRDDEAQIELWLRSFFAKVRFQRSINGHVSFRLVKSPTHGGHFVPLGVRLGVALPYICHNRSHAQLLCRAIKCMCIHGRTGMAEDDSASWSWSWSTLERNTSTVPLDKREALFAYWDPLPYCAYYHFQLPLESVKLFLQRRNRSETKSLSPRITAPVH